MADPKGQYFSPTGSETGWATVLPTRPHRSYANLFARDLAAQRKAAEAENKAKQAALAKLKGNDVGKLYHRVYQDYLNQMISEAPNKSSFELESEAIVADNVARATKAVSKIYDDGVKWITNKNNPVKVNELGKWWANRFANPTLEGAAALAESTPLPTEFLGEKGASQYIDVGRATKMVIKDQFQGYVSDKTAWERSGWERSPFGAVADINTFQTKVQAFSKYDPETNEVVMKSPTELVNGLILQPFLDNEYTKAAINDRARAIYADKKGIDVGEVDDLDIEMGDQALALQEMLTPYVQGVIAERGMTLAIRPSGGGGGTKEEKVARGFNLWRQQLSQGSPNAAIFPAGGKIGKTNEEVVSFETMSEFPRTAASTGISILASDYEVRRHFEEQPWFRGLTQNQKESIVGQTRSDFEALGGPKVAYTVVTRTPVAKSSGGSPPPIGTQARTEYEYNVRVIDPETATTSELRLLYDAGYDAGGGVHYDVWVGQEGNIQTGEAYQKSTSPWGGVSQPAAPAPNNERAINPLGIQPRK